MKIKLSSYQLKIIAIIAMTIDHIAWLFVKTASPAGFIMHFIGRLTAPVFCLLVSEGYAHTRDIRKYTVRMALFAALSIPAFSYYMSGSIFPPEGLGMIYTLALGLIAIAVLDSDDLAPAAKMLMVAAILALSFFGDWPVIGTALVILFYRFRDDRAALLRYYSLVIAVFILTGTIGSGRFDWTFLTHIGMFQFIPLYLAYSGELGGNKHLKYFFYIYYPVHLALIRFIYTMTK